MLDVTADATGVRPINEGDPHHPASSSAACSDCMYPSLVTVAPLTMSMFALLAPDDRSSRSHDRQGHGSADLGGHAADVNPDRRFTRSGSVMRKNSSTRASSVPSLLGTGPPPVPRLCAPRGPDHVLEWRWDSGLPRAGPWPTLPRSAIAMGAMARSAMARSAMARSRTPPVARPRLPRPFSGRRFVADPGMACCCATRT